jgi:hypothetical protein
MAERFGWRMLEHAVESEEPKAMLKQYIIYCYLRKRQDSQTLANWLERISVPMMHRALRLPVVGLYALSRLRALYTLMKTPELGTSQWVHLEKNDE